MTTIKLLETVGAFAENKDAARDIRKTIIIPALENDQEVILDFEGINSATQSFVHALISDLFRSYGNEVLDRISFRKCSPAIMQIITIVVDYMQKSDESK